MQAPPRFAVCLLLVALGTRAWAYECQRIEYAQLKDSSKQELTDLYCRATSDAETNRQLHEVQQRLFETQLANGLNTDSSFRKLRELGEARASCVGVAESALAMLAKRFKTKQAPRCPD